MLCSTRNMTKMVKTMTTLATNVSIDFGKKYEVWRKIQEAVNTLNTLQSNAQTLEKIRSQRNKMSHLNIPNMIKFASRAGISLDDVDNLNVIHVSGTKGKGSTCALTESILHHHGYKTGFFSSPHLVEVRERFRINGVPLSREKFAEYFWEVYNKLDETKNLHNDSMPAYFAFCTIMALHVFMKEKTDVAIMEVGIGGEYDSTNFIRKPVVCGVTSLGIDHTSILGTSIEKIAWHKAGIFKPGVPAFTAPQQLSALQVLQDRAKEIGNHVQQVPALHSFEKEGKQLRLGIPGSMQRVNAALAIQLSKTWMERKGGTVKGDSNTQTDTADGTNDDTESVSPLTQQMVDGLEQVKWAGRNQTIRKSGLTYFLDGAHTIESIQQCVDWFKFASKQEEDTLRGKVVKVVVFNTTGDRDTCSLMEQLKDLWFDVALFCPNLAFSHANTADLTNNTVTLDSQHKRCYANRDSWIKVHRTKKSNMHVEIGVDGCGDSGKNSQNGTNGRTVINGHGDCQDTGDKVVDGAQFDKQLHPEAKKPKLNINTQEAANVVDLKLTDGSADKADCDVDGTNDDVFTQVFPCIYDAISWASQGRDPLVQDNQPNTKDMEMPENLRDPAHIQILVTGSMHLVGGVLRTVDPDYN